MTDEQQQTVDAQSVQQPAEQRNQDRVLYRQQIEMAKMIAEQLGETEEEPVRLILRIVRRCGNDQTLAFLKETLEIEAAGGLMLPDGSRRRTPGGAFFFLVKGKITPELRRKIFFYAAAQQQQNQKPKEGNQPAASAGAKPAVSPAATLVVSLLWEDRLAIITDIGTEKGTANVKITVVGRPGKVVERGACIVTSMQATKVPALPKGVPTPPNASTTYVLYIATKQWKKVAESITTNQDDVLIVEGFPQIDAKTNSIAVFATNVTSKLLQATKRQGPSPTNN